ncbi:hypothetical protein [Planctopirus limnophila]|uniref:hypothetical protein n=1 Tax=Planctopirus limnophila TaxID=120 RepID=UPI0011D11778|nr:hypothetical protein [Planctopirus limnophila]
MPITSRLTGGLTSRIPEPASSRMLGHRVGGHGAQMSGKSDRQEKNAQLTRTKSTAGLEINIKTACTKEFSLDDFILTWF